MKNGKEEISTYNQSPQNNIASQVCVAKPQEINLAWLPSEIVKKEIGRYLSHEDIYYLSRTSHFLHTIFKQSAAQYIHQFLTCVARGEKNRVKAFLDKNPRLLLERITVTDEAGRKIFGTAFQIALGAKDVSPFPDQVAEMAEMIAGYFKKMPDGENEMRKQYAEQFPQGFEKLEAERQARDSEALKTMFTAIKNASTIASAKEAVDVFLNYLKAQTQQVIKTGYHFNEALFEEALSLYNNNYDDCGGFYSEKNTLASVKVLGGIQRYFTANLAQSACDGYGRVIDEKRALSRVRFKVLVDDVTTFFSAKLGVEHFVYCYGLKQGYPRPAVAGYLNDLDYKSYVKQKQQTCKTYATTLGRLKAPVCDVMMSK